MVSSWWACTTSLLHLSSSIQRNIDQSLATCTLWKIMRCPYQFGRLLSPLRKNRALALHDSNLSTVLRVESDIMSVMIHGVINLPSFCVDVQSSVICLAFFSRLWFAWLCFAFQGILYVGPASAALDISLLVRTILVLFTWSFLRYGIQHQQHLIYPS